MRDTSPPAHLKKDSNSSSTEPQWISQAKKYQKRWSLEKNEIDKPIQQEKTAPPLPPKKPKNENLDSKTPPSLPKNPPHSTSFIQRKPPGENVSLDNKFSKSSKTFMEEPRKNPQLGQETVGVREGFLTKMGEVHKNWKRRYFKLTETSLEYYSPTQIYGFFSNANPLGTIALKGCFINRVSEEQIGKKFCFSIDPPTLTRTYFIYADTEVEMENWIYSIQQVITSLAPKSRGSIIEIRKKNQSFMSAKKSGWLLKQVLFFRIYFSSFCIHLLLIFH